MKITQTDKEQILAYRAKTRKKLEKKTEEGGSVRKYARDNNLIQPILSNIINGKLLLTEKEYLPSSPRKKVVEALFRDGLWVGPIPGGMIIDPIKDFHLGGSAGGFDKNKNIVISNTLFAHLSTGEIPTRDHLLLIALVDATAALHGFSTVENHVLGKFLNMKEGEIEQLLQDLQKSKWLLIQHTENQREIKVIKKGDKNGSHRA